MSILDNIAFTVYENRIPLFVHCYRSNNIIAIAVFKLWVSVLVYSHFADYIATATNDG